MALPTFEQWLSERGIRTSLGIYPPQYGSGQYAPLYFAPISAGHLNAFANIHGEEHPELLNKSIKKKSKSKSKRKNKPKDKLKKFGL